MTAAGFARPTTRQTAGFTLLELLLALLLGSLLMLAVAAAIDIHLRLVRVGRTEVERAQLARALLGRIAHDLRSTVQYRKVDLSTYSASSSSSSSSGGAGAATPASSASSTSSSSSSSSTADNTTNLADATQLPTVFGLYGNLKELQLDVVRSPRADQIQSAVTAEAASTETVPLSGVNTITYFLASNTATASASSGLMRREVDRWQAVWLAEQGELTDAGREIGPLADEVMDVEFHYFDGTEWVDEWDTSERLGLPMAVEVALVIARPPSVVGLLGADSSSAAAMPRIYRMTVHLPMGEPTTLTTLDDPNAGS